jgi:serine/threonine protein kinase
MQFFDNRSRSGKSIRNSIANVDDAREPLFTDCSSKSSRTVDDEESCVLNPNSRQLFQSDDALHSLKESRNKVIEAIERNKSSLESLLVEQGILGRGQFGVVYKMALNENLVAVKKISRAAFDQNLDREISLMKCLKHHPNIVCYMASFYDAKNTFWIVMELIEGFTLRQRISDAEPFQQEEMYSLSLQLLDALSFLHGHLPAIIHRDLKPENILLNTQHHLFLADFGLSRPNSASISSVFRGTPLYASPEKLRGSMYNEMDDMWAVGCILLELVCARSLNEILEDTKDCGNSMEFADRTEKLLQCVNIQPVGKLSELLYDFARWCLCHYQDLRPCAAVGIDWLRGHRAQSSALESACTMAAVGRKLGIHNMAERTAAGDGR